MHILTKRRLKDFWKQHPDGEEQFWATQGIIDALIDKGDLTSDEQEYLNLLGTLIYLYEEDTVQIPELRGVALIKALLSERDLHLKDLVPIFKTESIVRAVLNGQRKLTSKHVDQLAEFFSLPHDLFFEPVRSSHKAPFVSLATSGSVKALAV